MLKVLKFGGSSLADGSQFAKVKNIVESDPEREVVVVSAPGKRDKGDNKITDLLYLIQAHLRYGVSFENVLGMVRRLVASLAVTVSSTVLNSVTRPSPSVSTATGISSAGS